jgi:hypothetical protein
LLAGKGFDHAHAAQVLLQRAGELRFLFLIGFVGFLDALEEEERDHHDHRHDDDREPGQPRVEQVDGGEVHHEEHDDAPGFDGLVGEEAADRVHVGGGALDQFARLRLVVIA